LNTSATKACTADPLIGHLLTGMIQRKIEKPACRAAPQCSPLESFFYSWRGRTKTKSRAGRGFYRTCVCQTWYSFRSHRGGQGMSIENIVTEVKAEIGRLNQVLVLLEGAGARKIAQAVTGKRTVSAAARKRMARAQRMRWKKIRAAAKKQ